jgi:hypothetical protein
MVFTPKTADSKEEPLVAKKKKFDKATPKVHPEQGRLIIRCKCAVLPERLAKAIKNVGEIRANGQKWTTTYVKTDNMFRYALNKNTLTVENFNKGK